MSINLLLLVLVGLGVSVAGVTYILRSALRWRHFLALGILAAVVFLYAAPLENYFVASGVWYPDPRQILTLIVGYLPAEQYLFIALQALLVGLFALWLWQRFYPADFAWKSRSKAPQDFEDEP